MNQLRNCSYIWPNIYRFHKYLTVFDKIRFFKNYSNLRCMKFRGNGSIVFSGPILPLILILTSFRLKAQKSISLFHTNSIMLFTLNCLNRSHNCVRGHVKSSKSKIWRTNLNHKARCRIKIITWELKHV